VCPKSHRAVACFCRRAIQLLPDDAHAYRNLAAPLADLGHLDKLLVCSRRAVELAPGSAAIHSDYLYALHYDPRSTPQSLFDEALRWGRRHGPATAPGPMRYHVRAAGSRMRVGHVSPDFRRHTIAHLIAPVLAAHDRNHFKIYCYSAVAAPDDVTQRLRSLAEHWRDISLLPDDAVVAQVRRDEIDVLVDLAGHMGGNRLTVFARRPAPVQVQLGYAGTTGLATMDNRITDVYCDPPGLTERYHTEHLIRLPSCAWLYEPDNVDSAATPLPADAAGHITFGSMNKAIKITDDALALWSEILNNVAGSKLLVLAGGTGAANHALR
jgi:protein O-GlcNAc transferase